MELFVKAQPDIDNLISSCFQVGNLLDSDDDDVKMQLGGAKSENCQKVKVMNTKIVNEFLSNHFIDISGLNSPFVGFQAVM